VYSLAQYAASASIYSLHYMDYEPRMPHIPISGMPSVHVRFALAIVAAYAAVEDLGLAIQASRENPSRIDGKWNPKVRDDLERRLVARGIDLNEPVVWLVRTSHRRIEKEYPLVEGVRTVWSGGQIKDRELHVCDAIARASRLRSKVAAHGYRPIRQSLSSYDVLNVQRVAGHLILRSIWTE
jgi:hypothetical protein